jgi:hypothetical protein
MDRERGDETPYGEPMKIPEHMDSTDLCPDGPSEDDIRRSVRAWLDEISEDFNAADFFECYIDPEGPFRYCGSFDAWDAIDVYLRDDPRFLADRLREWVKDGGG